MINIPEVNHYTMESNILKTKSEKNLIWLQLVA